MQLFGSVLGLAAALFVAPVADACTAMAVGKKATAKGVGTMATHTADCLNCDYRISKVPAKDHPEGAMMPVYGYRAPYPRYVGDDRGPTYHEDRLNKGIYNWTKTEPIGHIPQVRHTYAYVDGMYGIMNEWGVGFGESTCGGKLVALSVADGGHALFEVAGLTRVALERTKTAREAIELMGQLATEYGYYGADATGEQPYGEAGETLSVVDREEAWMFHILPDDTGKSAVWAAQRVPDTDIAVCGNQFIIRKMDLTDSDNYLASDNMLDVARRTGFFEGDDEDFDFAATFAKPMGDRSTYATRRVWAVFTKFAPNSNLPMDTNTLGDDYPFSITVETPMTEQELMAMNRDHYEGTPIDMTRGPKAQAWGNPNRYDMAATPTEPDPITADEATTGHWERAISIPRTAFSTVINSRSDVPRDLSMFWFSPHSPHGAVYFPTYVAQSIVPDTLSGGNRYEFDESIAFWVNMALSNYMERAWLPMINDVKEGQDTLETRAITARSALEEKLIPAIESGDKTVSVEEETTRFCSGVASEVVSTWWSFFKFMIAKFHDGYRIEDFHAETMNPTKLAYPKHWLQEVGYWDFTHPPVSPKQQPFNPPATTLLEAVDFQKTLGIKADSPLASMWFWLAFAAFFVVVGGVAAQACTKRTSYHTIRDAEVDAF